MAQTVVLYGARSRKAAQEVIARAPLGAVMTVTDAKRTVPQNSKMWAMLSDLSRAKPEGRVMPPEWWKAAFMAAIGCEIVWQPGIDGAPPFPAGFRSSKLTKGQMADLITMIQEYGDRHGVPWSDESRAA